MHRCILREEQEDMVQPVVVAEEEDIIRLSRIRNINRCRRSMVGIMVTMDRRRHIITMVMVENIIAIGMITIADGHGRDRENPEPVQMAVEDMDIITITTVDISKWKDRLLYRFTKTDKL